MLAYAANRPDPAGRRSSPNVMLVIVVAHIAAIAALMSAKTEIARIIKEPPLIRIPIDLPPPPPTSQTKPTKLVTQQTSDLPRPTTPKSTPVPMPLPQIISTGEPAGGDGLVVGAGTDTQPRTPKPLPVASGPALLTPASELRPPYPEAKLLNEEEATLHLKLSIDTAGRVAAVDPVGRADPVFLDAARRYLIAHWRYRPAMVGGQAVAATIVITLSFRLDG